MKKRLSAILVCVMLASMAGAARVYDAASYGIVPGTEKDMAPLMEQLLDKVKAEAAGRAVTIRLAPGTYHFYPEGAVHKEYYISNHDQHADRAVGIAIEGFSGLIQKHKAFCCAHSADADALYRCSGTQRGYGGNHGSRRCALYCGSGTHYV